MKGVNVGGKHYYNNLRYADDTALLAGNKKELSVLTSKINEVGKQFRMKINNTKNTKAMVVSKKPNSQKINIVIDRPGAIPTPESQSNDDSDSGIGVGIICSSFWWSRNRSRNRGDWNRSRNRGDWNRSWNRNQMTIPHIYVHVPSNINSGSNLQET